MNFTVERARRETVSSLRISGGYLLAIGGSSARRRKGAKGRTSVEENERDDPGEAAKGRDGRTTQQQRMIAGWKRREGQGKVVADRRQEEKGERNAKEQRCTRARVKGREVRITGEGGRQRRRSRWKKGRKREDKRMRGQTGLQAVGRR
ncbi:hypothetical protein K0M31_014790 [Melipona bicolor]|uniref:Uncharacterized protein n=1 Tax=Melipona bicolor TaxID=60889 RepID=A0AA40FH11_9HYME|nr:hypothetical protein K0M31_014790 [Melipona bicolor]